MGALFLSLERDVRTVRSGGVVAYLFAETTGSVVYNQGCLANNSPELEGRWRAGSRGIPGRH
ncbi:hypothetical protein [Kibdelosporangium banguiense]|uniref:hypothetical protein n=1 Tax=Kibdelosporangium banguiense TaxID=1365924 RepID=UPI001AE67E5F|nr:hypothetical protein [Kibdelosporangium banguiense]